MIIEHGPNVCAAVRPSRPGSSPVDCGARIDHIGVIVNDLEEARRWLMDVFGLPLLETVDLPEGRINGEIYACGDVDIEVLEVGDPEIQRRRLRPTRPAGSPIMAVAPSGESGFGKLIDLVVN